jgi:aryl-alcohol dehydrogenase (NADP+)
MDMRNLGATGMKVSSLCLGTMMFGPIGNNDHDDCVRIIHRALDAGINFIDTADVYSQGISEQIVGKALEGRREQVVLATKFFHPMGEDVNQRGGSRRWIVKAVENSLTRLGTDYIDLYQMHRFDSATDLDETLFALTDLVRQGKIRSFGSSCFPADRIVQAQWVADRRGHLPFRCEQSNYSLFNRDIERFVLPACQRHGMGMIVWSPLDGGFLSGKYRDTADIAGDNRISRFNRMFRGSFDPEAEQFQRKLQLVGALAGVADEAGLPMAQMAVAFAIEHPAVTSAIIGPRTMAHLESLLAVGEMKLAPAILDRIDALVPPGTSVNPIADVPNALGKESLRRAR